MDLKMYKECVEFRKLDAKFWSDDCAICYSQIVPSDNVGFACSHNACVSCFTRYLQRSMVKQEVPCCFLCRNMVCYMDVNDDENSKKKIMDVIFPSTAIVPYTSRAPVVMMEPDEIRPYHRVYMFHARDYRAFYAMTQSSFFLLIVFVGYYYIFS
jgi:hypothetical protein